MSNQGDFVGRIKSNWQQRAEEHTTFRAELRVIPRWPIWLMLALYTIAVAIVVCLGIFAPHTLKVFLGAPPALKVLGMIGIVTAIAAGVTLFVLFYGYIWADAKRRGMSPVLWLLVALLAPYLIGVILYFIVREPLPLNCPQCGRKVNSHFNFCPACQFNLRPTCPQCSRAIGPGALFCPHCGATLEANDSARNAQTAE